METILLLVTRVGRIDRFMELKSFVYEDGFGDIKCTEQLLSPSLFFGGYEGS